jgi:hypothetical protein
MTTLGFIMLRHVNNDLTNLYWNYSYRCIRSFYPENIIMIIDDNSNLNFVKEEQPLHNVVIINSELPPKRWWNRLDPTLIDMRMKALQGYLDELLKCVSLSESSLLREFLEVDVINLQVAKKKSMKGIDYNDRMKIIINDASKNMISISGYQRPTINKINSR